MDGYEPRRFQPESRSAINQVPAADGSGVVDARDVPAYGAAKAQEMAYLAELQDGWYAISNPHKNAGFGVRFDHNLYKYIWYWQQLGDVAGGYPWWGKLHCTALEPWTSYPTNGLNAAIGNGSALQLAAGETVSHRLIATAFNPDGRVQKVDEDGNINFVTI